MQHHQDITKDNSCRQEAKDASPRLPREGVPTQVASNDSPLPKCKEQTKVEQQEIAKNNIEMSPTSSHCVENDHTNITYELDQLNLTQPSRNLYKAKNNLRSIDETSLCLPFKAMTSPSTRHARNNSLLAHFNEITDQFKDTSPPDIIPYQGGKYAQNAKSLQQKLMQCNQNNDHHGISKKEDGREVSDCCSPSHHQMLLYQVGNGGHRHQLGDGSAIKGNHHPRNGDGSNCSSVSRFINSQQSGYMDKKFIAGNRHCAAADRACGGYPRQGHLDAQGIKVYKNKQRTSQQQFFGKEPASAQFDEIILEFDREYEKDQVTPRKKEDERNSLSGRDECQMHSNTIKQMDSTDVIATTEQKPNRQLTAKKNSSFKNLDRHTNSFQEHDQYLNQQQSSQKCLRLKITQSATQQSQQQKTEGGKDRLNETHLEVSQVDSPSGDQAVDGSNKVGGINISKTVLKNKQTNGRPIYLKIKIDGSDVQVKQDNSDHEEEMMSNADQSHLSSPEDCPIHSHQCLSNRETVGKGIGHHHGFHLGKRPNNMSRHYGQHLGTPARISAKKSQYHQSFDDMTCQTSQKNQTYSTPCQHHCSNWKDQHSRMEQSYAHYVDDGHTVCSGFADDISKDQNYTSRVQEVDLSDIVLKSEYDQHEQQAEAISVASFTEKTTMIQQASADGDQNKNQRVSVHQQNHKIVKQVITPRGSTSRCQESNTKMQQRMQPHFDDKHHGSCNCCLHHGGTFLENIFRKHYMEMEQFRAFAKHMMYLEYHQQHHQQSRGGSRPSYGEQHQQQQSLPPSQGQDSETADERVQSWSNYQGNIFKRQKIMPPDQSQNLSTLKPVTHQGSEVKTPGFNNGTAESPLALDRKFQPPLVQVQPRSEPAQKKPAAKMFTNDKSLHIDQQQASATSVKNTTENADPNAPDENKEIGTSKDKNLVLWEGSKALPLPPLPSRAAFGEITNSRMMQSSQFINDGRVQTEMPEMFFGVSKPFFSNTYKKREKKILKKVERAKVDMDATQDKKPTAENEDKKDKPKPRTQKNGEQKQALQIEFQKDPTWSNAQCKRISQQTGLSVAQVYKWGWDKKNRISASKQGHGAENMPGMMPLVLGDSSEYMIGPPHQQDFDRLQAFGMRGMGF